MQILLGPRPALTDGKQTSHIFTVCHRSVTEWLKIFKASSRQFYGRNLFCDCEVCEVKWKLNKSVHNIRQHFRWLDFTFFFNSLPLGTVSMTAFFLIIGFTKLSRSAWFAPRSWSFSSVVVTLLIVESFPVLTASTMSWASLLSFPPSLNGFPEFDSAEN